MRRVIGMDIHRTFAHVVCWEAGKMRPAGRVSMTRAGLERFGCSLGKEDEVVIEATGNAIAVVRVLSPYVSRRGHMPSCSDGWGRIWLSRQLVLEDERAASDRHCANCR